MSGWDRRMLDCHPDSDSGPGSANRVGQCSALLSYSICSPLLSYSICSPLFCSLTPYALLLNMPFSPPLYALLCSILLHNSPSSVLFSYTIRFLLNMPFSVLLSSTIRSPTQYALLCSVLLHNTPSSVLFSYTIVSPLFCSPTQYALLCPALLHNILSYTIRPPLFCSPPQYALLCSALLHNILSYSICSPTQYALLCPVLLHNMPSSVLFSYTIRPPLSCSPTQYALLLNTPSSVLFSYTIRSPTQYALLCSVLQASWVIHVKNTQKYKIHAHCEHEDPYKICPIEKQKKQAISESYIPKIVCYVTLNNSSEFTNKLR